MKSSDPSQWNQVLETLGLQSPDEFKEKEDFLLQKRESLRKAKETAKPRRMKEADAQLKAFEEAYQYAKAHASATGRPMKKKPVGRIVALLALLVLLGAGIWVYGVKQEEKITELVTSANGALEKEKWDEARSAYQTLQSESFLILDSAGKLKKDYVTRFEEKEASELKKQWERYRLGVKNEDWSVASDALLSLEEVRSSEKGLEKAREELAQAQFEAEKKSLTEQAEEAIKTLEWEQLEQISKSLEKLDSEDQRAEEWATRSEQEMVARKQRHQKAEELYTKALTLDLGVYNQEAIDLTSQALELHEREDIKKFHEVIWNYVRTIRVPSEIKTLEQAILECRPHDQILLAAGHYQASLSFSNGGAIIGEGFQQTVIEFPAEQGPVCIMGPKASKVLLNRLTLRHSSKTEAEDRYPLIMIQGGVFEADACEFNQSDGHGIVIEKGAEAKIQRCRIKHSGWDGVLVRNAQSLLRLNQAVIDQSAHHGIDVMDGGQIEVSLSLVSRSGLCGILLNESGHKSFVHRSGIKNSKHIGVRLQKTNKVTIEECEIDENTLGGVVVEDGCSEIFVRRNVIRKNGHIGILGVAGVKDLILEKNQFELNKGPSQKLDVILSKDDQVAPQLKNEKPE